MGQGSLGKDRLCSDVFIFSKNLYVALQLCCHLNNALHQTEGEYSKAESKFILQVHLCCFIY